MIWILRLYKEARASFREEKILNLRSSLKARIKFRVLPGKCDLGAIMG